MKSREIRQKFIEFFTRNGHHHLPSSPLIPADDPTLLFANAGMNQFKNIFLGQETRNYKRAVTIQKCMRAGGKHNDLDNVGRTSRHLTFFEMLGNFSFGDYFKKEAIIFAWDFLTKELKINPNLLFVTVYEEDQEAYDIWHKEIGLLPDRITRLGRKDNFWQMGDTGPCGPCSEIYVDKGASNEFEKTCKPGDECERFMEIWNLVFMQFNRTAEGTEIPLQKTGVDTGMGLERLASFLQGVESAFDCDIFEPILSAIGKYTGLSYAQATGEQKIAFRVLADHIRSSCLAIADGGMPSNEGRGYVIRKIIRRAALFAQKLGSSTVFADLAKDFIKDFASIYPELETNKDLIITTIHDEVHKFEHNLTQGVAIFKTYLAESANKKTISGTQAFKLYDTYGFPLELTCLLAEDAGFIVDTTGFEESMEQQRLQSGKKQEHTQTINLPSSLPATLFTGYNQTATETSIIHILHNNESVQTLAAGQEGYIITHASPFYVEGGGQVSDTGLLTIQNQSAAILAVHKELGSVILHKIRAPFDLSVEQPVRLEVIVEHRLAVQRNHTATHLLQSALMKTLGTHIKQAGSFVSSEIARFDFTHTKALTKEEINNVERLVNEQIMQAKAVECSTKTYQDALKNGVIAFFGEKYNPEAVRVVSIPDFSAELCGGTHVQNTGEIGCFKIIESTALSAGIRRIVAITGFNALEKFEQYHHIIQHATQLFKTKVEELNNILVEKQERVIALEKELQKKEKELVLQTLNKAKKSAKTIGVHTFIYVQTDTVAAKDFKELLRDASKDVKGIFCITTTTEKGIAFAVQANQIPQFPLSQLAEHLLHACGLRAKAQGDFMQGGGALTKTCDIEKEIINWIEKL